MPIFNRMRRRSLDLGQIGDYLRYALGEIILVVIGILIALRINTWNAERKDQAELHGILAQVQSDMAEDTLAIHLILRDYQQRKPMIRKLLNDSLDAADLQTCTHCIGFGLNYIPFYFKQSGFRALDRFQTSARSDSLVRELLSFYNGSVETVEQISEMVGNDAASNNNYLRDRYEWYSQGMAYVQGIQVLQLHDHMYRNRLLFHYELAYNNYLGILEAILDWERETIAQLEARLNADA